MKKLFDDERFQFTEIEIDEYLIDAARESDYETAKLFLNHERIILNEECKTVIKYCSSSKIIELFLQDERTTPNTDSLIDGTICKHIRTGEYEILKTLLKYYPKRRSQEEYKGYIRRFMEFSDERKLNECLYNRITFYGIKNVEKLKLEHEDGNYNISLKSKKDYERTLLLLASSDYISKETRKEYTEKLRKLYDE